METKCCAVKPVVWSMKLSYVLIVAKFAIMLKTNMKPLIRNDKTNTHRIFLIKRRGHFFKTQPCTPGIYSGPGVYLFKCIFQPAIF